MKRGEAFRSKGGLPESEVRAATQAAEPTDAREGMADGLAAVTLAMVEQDKQTPEVEELRLALCWAVVPANAELEPLAELEEAHQ
ncbi:MULTISPECIES: hypothetical protein [Streptomyces]|uniref:hypothetical protein n=1 Tax=Streptomyces TaxID=1883 RepID=UPI0021809F1B|nr:hypothetical protein [Streptomyces sp. gCLA4]